MRRGARDLGLQVKWQVEFVRAGTALQSMPDAVILDVGNDLGPGVFDQHQDQRVRGSTAELVVRYPAYAYDHLMARWLAQANDGVDLQGRTWSPVLVTHAAPDFDAVVSILLVMHLIETGVLPPFAEALAQYSALVDQGRYQIDLNALETATHAVHMAYLELQHQSPPPGQSSDRWHVAQGLELLRETLGAVVTARGKAKLWPMTEAGDLLPDQPGVASWRALPAFESLAAELDADSLRARIDYESADLRAVRLPAADGGPDISVGAWVARGQPTAHLNKYWVRAAGYPFFICPRGSPREQDGSIVYPSVILSIDPTWSEPGTDRRPTLRGLGFELERLEATKRASTPEGDCRSRVPRWPDGTCTNGDPWYDGRGHDFTILDAPRSGTQLAYREVTELATGGSFWRVRLQSAVVAVIEAAPEVPWSVQASPAVRPPGLAPALDDYFGACVDRTISTADVAAPPGFEVSSVRVRSFPQGTAPPLRVIELRAGSGAYLEDVTAWVADRRARAASGVFVVGRLVVGPGLSSPERIDVLIDELGGGGLELQSAAPLGRELLLVNSRTIALRADAGGVSDTRAWLELLIHVAFVQTTLSAFSSRIGQAVDARGRVHGAHHIRYDFLRFQTRYRKIEVATGQALRACYRRIAEELALREHFDSALAELDRLEQAADREASEKVEWLLFFIGLAGVVSAILAFPRSDQGWSVFRHTVQPSAIVAVGALGSTAFWYLRRRRRRRQA